MRTTTLLTLSLVLLASISCIKKNGSDNPPTSRNIQVIILNEGNYMSSNASMTGYDPHTKIANQELFSQMSGGESVMGDSPTCIYQYGKTCYLSMSGSGKIYAFDPEKVKLLHTIKGLSSPRFMYATSNKMWITDLNNSVLTQVDLSTKEITKQANIESPAEMLVSFGNYLYSNLWNCNKKIIKLNPVSGEVIESLEVGIQPYSMAVDRKNGKLWVICDGGQWEGNPVGFEDPSLFRIDISGEKMKIEKRFDLPRTNGYFLKIAIATDYYGNPIDDNIYFLNNDIYRMNRNSDILPSEPFIKSNGNIFYALAVNENNEIYISDAIDYISEGACYIYDNDGKLIDSFSTGISPGFIYFHSNYE